MASTPVHQIVLRYSEAAAGHLEATETGDYKRANSQQDIVAAAYRELRERGGETALLPLLEHDNPGVRSWAGAHALEFAPAEGERVLQELSGEPGISGFNAQMTLDTWRAGELRFP